MARARKGIALAALAVVGIAAAAGGAKASGGTQGSGAPPEPPQRTPTPRPATPTTPEGNQQSADEGRVWRTWYVNRDEVKTYEVMVFRVASDPSNPNVGTGEVVADVFETIEGNGERSYYITRMDAFGLLEHELGSWTGQACRAVRYRLQFDKGRLVKWFDTSLVANVEQPTCATVRPMQTVYLRSIEWLQRGPDVFLKMRTASGISKAAVQPAGSREAGMPLKSTQYRWDNRAVRSGDVVVDVSWIFNPA